VPATAVAPGPFRRNVAAVMVDGFIDSLNVAEITWFTGTPVAPATGTVEVTEGATVAAVSFPHPPKNTKTKAVREAIIPSLRVRIYYLVIEPVRHYLRFIRVLYCTVTRSAKGNESEVYTTRRWRSLQLWSTGTGNHLEELLSLESPLGEKGIGWYARFSEYNETSPENFLLLPPWERDTICT